MKDISEKEELSGGDVFSERDRTDTSDHGFFDEDEPDVSETEDFFDFDEEDAEDFDTVNSNGYDEPDEDFDDPDPENPEDFSADRQESFDSDEPDASFFEAFGQETEEEDLQDGDLYPEFPEETEDVFPEENDKETVSAGAKALSWFKKGSFVQRAAIMAAAGALCVLIVFGIVAAVMNSRKSRPVQEDTADPGEQIVLVQQLVSDVKFLSFGPLSVNDLDGYVSVKEFSQILDTLYEEGYVLVDIYSIGSTGESGDMILNKTIDIPEGKKPLVLMQRDVSYPISRQDSNFARKLVVDAEGAVRAEYSDADGEPSMGDYDLIPMVETFIREHPDFSYNGARGIAGLTGYNGILGYRTSAYLGSETDNPYGVFDTDNETLAMQGVLETLRKNGWRFASNGFGHRISYGSEYSLVENDTASWKDQVSGLIGGTDILMLPRHTDIGSWAPYDEGNAKYTLMRGLGFRIYLAADDETPGFMLARNEYLRIAVAEIDSYSEFEAALSGGPIPETVISAEPAAEEPQTEATEGAAPETTQAAENSPEGTAPETAVTDESTPEGTAPETTVTDESTPEGTVPEAAVTEEGGTGSAEQTEAGQDEAQTEAGETTVQSGQTGEAQPGE